MTLGYCAECEKLVAIVARELVDPWGPSLRRNWYPVDHDDARGKPCRGSKKPI